MKTLYLMRHAKSSWEDESLPDHDRPLNHRGLKDAQRMARLFIELKLRPDLIVTSTATRARATAERFAREFSPAIAITETSVLYHASPDHMLDVIHRQSNDIDSLMLVGHNPGMESFVTILNGSPLRMPTAAIALFEVNCDQWTDLNLNRTIRARDCWRPKEL